MKIAAVRFIAGSALGVVPLIQLLLLHGRIRAATCRKSGYKHDGGQEGCRFVAFHGVVLPERYSLPMFTVS
jgi:hypothetical protein